MAVITGSTQIQTDNKRGDQIETGSYNITIVGEWVFDVIEESDGFWQDGTPKKKRKYSKEPTGDRDIKVSVTLDDAPEIAIAMTMTAYISKNSKFGKMVESLTGIPIKELQAEGFDTKKLIGMKAVADIKNAGEWINIKEIRARPKALVRPAVRPIAERAFTPEDARKLGVEPMDEAQLDESEIPF